MNQYAYGGYVCENIYFLGRSGVINYKGIRIAGISGIFNEYNYHKGYYETNLLERSQKISVYHTREFDIMKMNLITNPVDIFLSHDWPFNVVHKDDVNKILKVKKGWDDLENGEMGSRPSRYLMNLLKPKFWVCGHMHYYYKTIIDETTFIALDKIINQSRQWLDFIEIKAKNDLDEIVVDQEWLVINKVMKEYYPMMNLNYSYKAFALSKEYNKFVYIKNAKVMQPMNDFIENKKKKLAAEVNDIIPFIEDYSTYKKYILSKYEEVDMALLGLTAQNNEEILLDD